MANAFLPSRYLERVVRGAVALQLWDGARDGRLRDAVAVLIERETKIEPQWARLTAAGRPDDVDEATGWYRFPKRRPDLHALVYPEPRPTPPKTSIEVRIYDQRWRYTPRRVGVPVPAAADPDEAVGTARPNPRLRVRRTALYPGPAYGLTAGSTGIRGRVRRGGLPVRWARAIVAGAAVTDPPIAVAHGDHKGEFLLILPPLRSALTAPAGTLQLSLQVAAAPAPSAATLTAIKRDPLADLVLESMDPAIGIPDADLDADVEKPDPKAMGWALPGGYTVEETRTVTFTAGRIHRETFDV